MATPLPTIMTKAGLQPQSVDSIRQQIITQVTTTNPGFTANLPGALVEDVVSTDTASVSLMDQFRVELVNSLTPYGANAFLVNQQGAMIGLPQGTPTNTTVGVVFTGTVGYVLPPGFIVSDGTYQYALSDGGVIETGGSSASLTAVALQSGTFEVGAGTVTQIVSAVSSGYSLSVTNPLAGTPGTTTESTAAYRARVLDGVKIASVGTPTYTKTLLRAVPGVVPYLVSIPQSGSGYEVICGGGDDYAVATAIYQGVLDISSLVGSTMSLTAVTQANPGVVTTLLNHGYATGQVVTFQNVGGMTELNTGNYTITVISEKSFSIGVDTSSYTPYTSGGEVLPNLRNVTVSLIDDPNTYSITFVRPPQQTVTIAITWNTDISGFTGASSVNQLAVSPSAAYVNGLPVGKPINLLELQAIFQTAVADVLPTDSLTTLTYAVTINGVSVLPATGTSAVYGDPESYFYVSPTGITVAQG